MELNFILVVAIVFLLLFMLYRYMKETFTVLERLNIPGPKPVWVFGNVQEFKDKFPLDVFQEWRKIYGKVFGFYEGFRASIVVNDPDMARHILSKQFQKFHIRTPYRAFRYYPINRSIMNLEGETWKSQRYIINKLLNFGNISQMVIDKITQRGKQMIETIERERVKLDDDFNLTECIHQFVSGSALSLIMRENDFEENLDTLFEYQQAAMKSAAADNPVSGFARLFPPLSPFLQVFDGEHRRAHNKAVALLRRCILRALQEENNNAEKSEMAQNILSQLLSCKVLKRDSDGSLSKKKLEEDEVIAHVLALFGETFDTTSSAILFMLYELALHPDLQDRIYKEIDDLYKTEDEEIGMSQLQSLSYMDMCLNETLRLHPVAPGLSRVCAEDCVINGYQFKKGIVVRTMTCTLYQDEQYFPEPEKFDPERFSQENKKNRHLFAFMPFGQGPRMCPGTKLSQAMIKLAVVLILQKYSLHRNENTEVPLKIALRPALSPANVVKITFKERR